MIRYIILFLIITTILILTICYIDNNMIEFLDSTTTYNIIKSNTTYYNTMTVLDMKVRNINSIDMYYPMIKNSVVNFSNNEKEILQNAIEKANMRIENITLPWFNGREANKLKWKIGLVQGRMYEYGLPHTIDDTIIINRSDIGTSYDNMSLIDTLIHEKVHIYQKAYPNQVMHYLDMNGFKAIRKRNKMDIIRANPDIDNTVYSKEGRIYATEYNDSPQSIVDVMESNQMYEHPFERMAIEITNL
jgi:hypothetical protein